MQFLTTTAGTKNLAACANAYDGLSQHLMALTDALRKSIGMSVCAHSELDAAGATNTFLTGLSTVFLIRCAQPQTNVLQPCLEATILSHLPSGLYRRVRVQPELFASHRYRYIESFTDVARWVDDDARFFSTAELASHLLELYVEHWLQEVIPESAGRPGKEAPRQKSILENRTADPTPAVSVLAKGSGID